MEASVGEHKGIEERKPFQPLIFPYQFSNLNVEINLNILKGENNDEEEA